MRCAACVWSGYLRGTRVCLLPWASLSKCVLVPSCVCVQCSERIASPSFHPSISASEHICLHRKYCCREKVRVLSCGVLRLDTPLASYYPWIYIYIYIYCKQIQYRLDVHTQCKNVQFNVSSITERGDTGSKPAPRSMWSMCKQ